MKTKKRFITKLFSVLLSMSLLLAFVPTLTGAAETADTDVQAVYDAYSALQDALESNTIDTLESAAENFESVLDIFNELDEEQFEKLGSLLGVASDEAFGTIFWDWITTNVILETDKLYQAYLDNSNESTALDFVDYYDSIFNDPEYKDEVLEGQVRAFISDVDDVYSEALSSLMYTITWVVDDEEYDETSVRLNDTITAPENPTKDAEDCTVYTFKGWSDTEDGEILEELPIAEGDMTFYAIFTEKTEHGLVNGFEYYIIDAGTHAVQCKDCEGLEVGEETAVACTFDKNTHKCIYCGEIEVYSIVFMNGDEEFTSTNCAYGWPLALAGMPIPKKEGYTFAGWYTKDKLKVVHGIDVTEDLVAYATWEKIVTDPETPDTSASDTSAETNGKDVSPKTGDNSNILLWLALMLISGGTVILLTVYGIKGRTRED